jgi:hypothetical protein
MKVKNNTHDILNAVSDYAFNRGLVTIHENAIEAAIFTRDTHYEMWDEEIEIDLDELDRMFNLYRS